MRGQLYLPNQWVEEDLAHARAQVVAWRVSSAVAGTVLGLAVWFFAGFLLR